MPWGVAYAKIRIGKHGNKDYKKPNIKVRIEKIAKERFGDLVKGAVDIEKGIMALGGELHIDEEIALIEKENSKQENVWGINIYPDKEGEEFIGFDSMINIKPSFGNRTRGIDNENIKLKIKKVISELIK